MSLTRTLQRSFATTSTSTSTPSVGSRTNPYDILGIGFGPANLAIAIALSEKKSSLSSLFLERQSSFAWHKGMMIPGAKMQISFLKDFATLRDPTSKFTFLNYLKQKDKLQMFANLPTFLPSRMEYSDYMSWCADQVSTSAKYNQTVTGISLPEEKNLLCVEAKDGNQSSSYYARNIVISVGGVPQYGPFAELKASNPSTPIYHSSQFRHVDTSNAKRIAVVGGGQSAAEIFNHLCSTKPDVQVDLYIKDSALRPADDSPFVNEIFDPERRFETFAKQSDAEFLAQHARDKATNYGVVRIELIEEIYKHMYDQKYFGTKQNHRIIPNSPVTSATQENDRLFLQTKSGSEPYDLAFVATGYQRNFHKQLLQSVSKNFTVNKDYSISCPNSAGIYLQGCNEQTHGLSDTLLSVLAIRGYEVVQSIENRPHWSKEARYTYKDNKFLMSTAEGSKLEGGKTLMKKEYPGLGEFSIHIAGEKDLQVFNKWQNDPRVSKFWNETGSVEQHKRYLSQFERNHSIGVIGNWDSNPFAYYELYWAKDDLLGKYYDVQPFDRGVHMLVGESKYRGPERVRAWLGALAEYMFAEPKTQRIVAEPRADNAKMIDYFVQCGFEEIKTIQLPHKKARLVMMTRSKFEAMKGQGRDEISYKRQEPQTLNA